MSKIVWTESAVDDLNRHYEFLKINNADAAVRAVQKIVSTGESLQENPCRGKTVDRHCRIAETFSGFWQIWLYHSLRYYRR